MRACRLRNNCLRLGPTHQGIMGPFPLLRPQFQPPIRLASVAGTVGFERMEMLITANPMHGHCALDATQKSERSTDCFGLLFDPIRNCVLCSSLRRRFGVEINRQRVPGAPLISRARVTFALPAWAGLKSSGFTPCSRTHFLLPVLKDL
jgi:hypothetical protein